MATRAVPLASAVAPEAANGRVLACFLGAGFGAFAMGLVVLLNEIGLLTAPTLYAPAGGVSGRTTLATILWLVAWGVLHQRWKGRDLSPRPICLATLTLIALGVLATFPLFWKLL